MIHVPERNLGEAEGDSSDPAAPAKKRTRRGSRGGKNRRKKPVGEGGALAVAPLEAEEQSVNGAEPEVAARARARARGRSRAGSEPVAEGGDDDWGYTPMSEWGMDER